MQRSQYNNTNVSLNAYGQFVGRWESTGNYLEIAAYVNSTAYLALTIQQSIDASNVDIPTTWNYTPNTEVSVFSTAVGLPFYRVILANVGATMVGHMSLTTLLFQVPQGQLQIAGTADVAVVNAVDVSGATFDVSQNLCVAVRTLPALASGNNTIGNVNIINIPLVSNSGSLPVSLAAAPFSSSAVDISHYGLYDIFITCADPTVSDTCDVLVSLDGAAWFTVAHTPFANGVALFTQLYTSASYVKVSIPSPTRNYTVIVITTAKTR